MIRAYTRCARELRPSACPRPVGPEQASAGPCFGRLGKPGQAGLSGGDREEATIFHVKRVKRPFLVRHVMRVHVGQRSSAAWRGRREHGAPASAAPSAGLREEWVFYRLFRVIYYLPPHKSLGRGCVFRGLDDIYSVSVDIYLTFSHF